MSQLWDLSRSRSIIQPTSTRHLPRGLHLLRKIFILQNTHKSVHNYLFFPLLPVYLLLFFIFHIQPVFITFVFAYRLTFNLYLLHLFLCIDITYVGKRDIYAILVIKHVMTRQVVGQRLTEKRLIIAPKEQFEIAKIDYCTERAIQDCKDW